MRILRDDDIMQAEHKTLLGEFLERTAGLSVSIVLVGSQVDGNAREDSDIDLIIVTRCSEEAEAVRRIEEEMRKPGLRPLLDCKVYTEHEFLAAKAGRENRFLWTCLTNGRILSGQDVASDFSLIPRAVVDSVWECIQNVQEACDKLESGVQFTGCCYHIYDALATIYFIDRLILRSVKASVAKGDYIKSYLGEQYTKARERHYWVVRHTQPNKSQHSLRVPANIDRRFKGTDYSSMLPKGKTVLELLQGEFRQITKWADLHSAH